MYVARLSEGLVAQDGNRQRGGEEPGAWLWLPSEGAKGAEGSQPPTGTGGAPSARPPHANPVITRLGFPLQTPGSTWFLHSHRIRPGLSCPGQGAGAPRGAGALASLLPFQRPRGQSRSKPPAASRDRTAGLSVIPGGPGLGKLSWTSCSQGPHLPEASAEPPRDRASERGDAAVGPWSRGQAAWFSLRDPGGRQARGSVPEGAGPLAAATLMCLPRPVTPTGLPVWPHARQQLPCGCQAMGVAVNVSPPDLRGHRDSGVPARVGPTGCLGLVWPHFFSWETGLLLPPEKVFTLPRVGPLAAVRVHACACVHVCAPLCVSQEAGGV